MLHIDVETFSSEDIKSGVYKYVEAPDFAVLLFAYMFEGGEVQVVDLAQGEELPPHVLHALTDPAVVKVAHNAPFEFVTISTHFGLELDWSQWRCTMVMAAYLGLPLALDQVTKVLHLGHQKDAKGKLLIKYFTVPVKPTKTNGERYRNLPQHAPEKWQQFKDYNRDDVLAEWALAEYCKREEALPAHEWGYWELDQRINERGVPVDVEFTVAAIAESSRYTEGVHEELRELTGLDNPNSLPGLKAKLAELSGVEVPSLNKDFFKDFDPADFDEVSNRIIELRQDASNTSVSKYDTLLRWVCDDERVRGLLQFYGANRTGREAGRGVQPQNLKRTPDKGIDEMREAIKAGSLDLIFGNVQEIVSKLIRTAFAAPEGSTFVIGDFSAIEARVLAWLAGEEWVLEVFRGAGKIYEATASRMFNVPIEQVTKGSHWRSKGKVANLALGYQGAAGALVQMGALREGLTEAELPAIVAAWRKANPNIVRLWRKLEEAAKHVIARRTSYRMGCLTLSYERGTMFIRLPSGRRLAYQQASLQGGSIVYYGVDQLRKTWTRQDTYGGKLAENVTQAIARDCLWSALWKLRDLPIVLHVHDEVVVETLDGVADLILGRVRRTLAEVPEWAPGLPLGGEVIVSNIYIK